MDFSVKEIKGTLNNILEMFKVLFKVAKWDIRRNKRIDFTNWLATLWSRVCFRLPSAWPPGPSRCALERVYAQAARRWLWSPLSPFTFPERRVLILRACSHVAGNRRRACRGLRPRFLAAPRAALNQELRPGCAAGRGGQGTRGALPKSEPVRGAARLHGGHWTISRMAL